MFPVLCWGFHNEWFSLLHPNIICLIYFGMLLVAASSFL